MMKATHILLLIAACCISVQAFATEKLSVQELLNKYAENQDKMKSFIAKTESVWIPSPGSKTDQQQQNRSKSIVEFRYEDIGKDFKAYFCRTPLKLESDGTWVENNASRSTKILWRDKRYYQYYKGPRLAVSNLYVTADAEYAGNEHFEIAYDGVGPFLGFLCGDRERIDSILRQSDSLSVRPDLDRVGSVKCYVIDAVSMHGTYTIWFDPEHGYGIAKAIVRKGPEDLRRGRPRSYYIINSIDNSTEVMQNVRFERLNGIWFTMEYERLSKREYEDRTQSGRTQYNVTYLDVNPDHNDLGSFSLDGLDIQDGTQIRIGDAPGKPLRTEYAWQEGMKFVVDEWDGSIRYVPEDWSIRVGVGKPMPEFEGIDLDLSAEDISDKAILLCLLNMNQRPSRNCLLQLNAKAQELKARDIVIVGIQVSKIDKSDLSGWIREYNIPFPVGMIQGDEEKIRFSWGVRSLPWLILTSKEHVVTAEGFTLAELNEKLNGNSH